MPAFQSHLSPGKSQRGCSCRRQKRRKSADAFLAELATLSPGDLVVHTDHGIGRYIGLTSVPVGKSPHDCVALEYAGGDKLYVPVQALHLVSRYTGAPAETAPILTQALDSVSC